jgi:hypothetical protein
MKIELDREHYNQWIEQELEAGTREETIIEALRELTHNRYTEDRYRQHVQTVREYMAKRPSV